MHRHHDNPTRSTRRTGMIGLVLVLGLVLLAGASALAINYGLITYVHDQLRTGSVAAALDGAAQFQDKNVLYPDRMRGIIVTGIPALDGPSPNPVTQAANRSAQATMQGAMARSVAIQVALLNSANHMGIVLQDNPANDPTGDIVLGNVAHPTQAGSPFVATSTGQINNSMVVRARQTAARSNALTLFLGQLIGMPTADVAAGARATVDQQVIGFRPRSAINVPVAPFAATGAGLQSFVGQAYSDAIPGSNDNFIVNYNTGSISNGADGIPEIILQIPIGGGTSNGRALHIGGLVVGDGTAQIAAQLTQGLSSADLVTQAGSILTGNNELILSITGGLTASHLAAAFNSQVGQVVALPYGVETTDGGGNAVVQIQGFAGAILIDAFVDLPNSQVVCTFQPALLRSDLAVVQDGAALNPWLAKVEITQ
jgi:hypothetical protein